MENKTGIQWITRTAVLLAIALAVQALHLPTLVTGSVINGVLVLTAISCGFWAAVLIGCITPWMALVTGIIPPAVVPLVPVIIAANITIAGVFFGLQRFQRLAAVIVAALAKFLVFFVTLRYLLQLFQIKIPAPALAAFQIPQLITALVGGITAVIVARYLERALSRE